MKKNMTIGILFICLCAFASTDHCKTFKKLYALEGTWKMTGKRGAIFEEWVVINDNYLQSRGYMIRIDDTVITERVALTCSNNGIFYTSTVEDQNNKKPVTFTMTSNEGNQFVFENPGHDFPKRIVYRLITGDSLHAFIDDGAANTRRQNFYFKRHNYAIQPR
jgi:Domain of unknown function (DUF6265)